VVAPAPPADRPGSIVVPRDTPVRLMVLDEVSGRKARPGDRFPLRVDAAVALGGLTIIAVGARAWGEIVEADASGGRGRGGKLAARLVAIEAAGEPVPIGGERVRAGDRGTVQLALGALALGPLALLARGNEGKLKAGDIVTGHFESDMLFDPATGRLTHLSSAAGR